MELVAVVLLSLIILVVAIGIILLLSLFFRQTSQIKLLLDNQENIINDHKQNLGEFKSKHLPRTDSQPLLRSIVPSNFKNLIKFVVLTGGPCAGKTTALTYISEKCQEKGIKTFIVPEAATLLCKGGFSLDNSSKKPNQVLKFQINLMKVQMSLEDIFLEIANMETGPILILCDRGAMDGKAYMNKDEWQALLDETGWSTVQLRDKRYDAVIHMVTSADGAEKFYNLNNIARSEALDTAIQVDKRTSACWMAHPSFHYIDNNVNSFKEKIDKTFECVLRQFGIPHSTQFFKKYLLERPFNTDILKIPESYKHETIEIEDSFIQPASENILMEKVRRRGQKDSFTYQYLLKYTEKGQIIECRKAITAREYMNHCDIRNLRKGKPKMLKIRQCFMWEKTYFKIDTYSSLNFKPSILIVEVEPTATTPVIPTFMTILREITDEPHYTLDKMLDPNWDVEEKDKIYVEQKKRLGSEAAAKEAKDKPKMD